jgi:hypothetical protein
MARSVLRGLQVLAGVAEAVPGHRADRPVDAPTLADHLAYLTGVHGMAYLSPDGTGETPCAACVTDGAGHGLTLTYLARHRAVES